MPEAAPRDTLTSVDETSGRTVYYDDDRGTYHTWYDGNSCEPVSTALLLTLSSVLAVDPTDLETLSEYIEPDALNSLVGHWQRDEPRAGSVSFAFAQCGVTIHADGELVIDPAHRSATSNGN
ncbi:HalOD1 output domain-containing protein [Haloarchaeobius amylolyticus]|uniref:HalOD1 output domain-containing protein n=1 Tax=Haloarchaeobius amylolyticus TaxID=1198296 RepID=A0ABD6BGQ7_9EURY